MKLPKAVGTDGLMVIITSVVTTNIVGYNEDLFVVRNEDKFRGDVIRRNDKILTILILETTRSKEWKIQGQC